MLKGCLRLRHIMVAAIIGVPAIFPGSGFAADAVRPGVVYDLGGKYDHSFNEGIYDGVKRWADETGQKFSDFELTNETQREQAIRTLAENGADPVIAVGFAAKDTLEAVAPDFPKTRFLLIDVVGKGPNVGSITANYAEGSFLVGVLGGMASKTDKIGFVGGMDIPLIRSFSCGYHQGAHYARADIGFVENMTGTTPDAWHDPIKGAELAKSQFDRGADVVFAAAGKTGDGVLRAAHDAHRLGIGVGLNQDGMFPGSVLTSMVAHFDQMVYLALKSMQAGTWKPGNTPMGIKDGAVGWTQDQYNAALITPEMKAKVEEARSAIIGGKLTVVDYLTNNSCPL